MLRSENPPPFPFILLGMSIMLALVLIIFSLTNPYSNGIEAGIEKIQKEAVELDIAQYNPKNKEFEWVIDGEYVSSDVSSEEQ